MQSNKREVRKQYNQPAAPKQCYFSQNNIKHIDYKDLDVLKKFLNPHARLSSKKRTGVDAKNQRKLAVAIRRARFMGLLPFVAR